MKLNSFKISAVAFAALALVATSANAATTTLNYNQGDLLIGFGNGGTNDYVIDLGQASNFIGVTGTETITGLGNLSADLGSASLFGSSWNTTAGVKWGAIADDQSGNINPNADIIYVSNASSASWNDQVVNNTPMNDTETIGNSAYNSKTSTANSPVGLIEAASLSDSWSYFESTVNGGTGKGSNSGSFNTYLPGITTGVGSNLYLDETFDGDTAAGTTLGHFDISSNGTLTFTGASVASVPEPSTYALMILGGLLMLGWKFRRSSKNA